MSLKVAYLINQYPKVSHSFIRREIQALENKGIEVLRYALRSCGSELVDAADAQELSKTRYLLDVGGLGLFKAMLRVGLTRPIQFVRALKLVVQMGSTTERGILYHLIYLAEACLLLGWLTQAEVKHLHVHFGTNATTVALLCEALGGPSYSFTVHGPEEFDKVQGIALPQKIARAAFVVAISSFGKSQLYRWCRQDQWSKIHVVRCGLENALLHQAPQPLPAAPNLVCIGRLCEQKGQLLLIEAAKQLADQGLAFNLTLVGDGPMRQQLEQLIERYHLQSQLTITGWASSPEVQQHLINATAMVLPSFAEGLPVVIMESLALNRPVITTYVAGIPELIEPGVSGWLISPGSIDQLVEALRSVLEATDETLLQMGANGAARVRQYHNMEVEAHKLASLMRLAEVQGVRGVQDIQTDELQVTATAAAAPAKS